MAPSTPTVAQSPSSANPSAIVASLLAEGICPPEPTDSSHNDLPGTDVTLRWIFVYVGLICLVLSGVACLLNFASHLVWRRNIKEQKQLMRISLLPFVFVIFSWCSVDIYGINAWLDPLPKLYEIYCVASFFNFMVQVLTPDEKTRVEFFVQSQRMNRRAKKEVHSNGNLRWFRFCCAGVYLALFFMLVITLLVEAVASTVCHLSPTYALYSIILEVLSFVFTVTALVSLIRMYMRFRSAYQGTKLLHKFWTFKSFVWLIIHQQIILGSIRASQVVTPTKYMSLADFTYGVPEFMICCEGMIFSFIYMTTLSGRTYRKASRFDESGEVNHHIGPDASVGRYLFEFLVPTDVLRGTWQAFYDLARLPLGRKAFDYTGGTGVGHKERNGLPDGHKEDAIAEI